MITVGEMSPLRFTRWAVSEESGSGRQETPTTETPLAARYRRRPSRGWRRHEGAIVPAGQSLTEAPPPRASGDGANEPPILKGARYSTPSCFLT
jgi:hypothetical protein